MKKVQNLALVTIILVLAACNKTNCNTAEPNCHFNIDLGTSESVIPDDQLLEYYEIWKSIMLVQSEMSVDYFNDHITDYRLSSTEWSGGISFKITYILTIDWVDIRCSDEFLVKMNASYDAFTHLDIPRDVFLSKEEIEFNIANEVHSDVSRYQTIETLKYSNCAEVFAAVNETENTNITLDYVTYYVPGKLPREDGDPYYMLSGNVCGNKNECWSGYINLVTGEKEIWKDACIIVG
jgi:hypothetical protein